MVAATLDVPLRNTRFDNHQFNALGVEWMTLADLMRRVPAQVMRVPERLDFYMVLLVTAGTGSHMVDFVESVLTAGTVVFVRPGQVQQWRPDAGVEGNLVLVAPQAMMPAVAGPTESTGEGLRFEEWPSVFALPAVPRSDIETAMQQLQRDFERFDHTELDAALIRLDVQGLLMRLARWRNALQARDAGNPADQAVYRLFLRELENGFRQRLSVQHYAARLGYAESTLTRACKAAAGRSAKQLIDRRIALEAGRELVHSHASVAEIAHRLGFSETTNFVKFFSRMHAMSPLTFRHRMRLR